MDARASRESVVRRPAFRLLPALILLLLPRAAEASRADAARDTGVVVVVSSESPVTEIPGLHLADLYLGRTSRFPDGEPAVPLDRAPGSPVREAFYRTFVGRTPAEIKAHWARLVFTGRGRPPPEVESGEAMRERVAADPRAIGYLDRSLVDASVRAVSVR